MPTISNDQRCPGSNQVVSFAFFAVSLLVLSLLFNDCAFGSDTRELLHQKILAGDQVSLNPSDPEGARTIDSKWLEEAASRHLRVDIHHAVIQGRLDAEDVTFDQGFTVEGCIFTGFANFSHAVFKHGIEASESVFRSGVSFQRATFEHNASFGRSQFEGGPITFAGAHFLEKFRSLRSQLWFRPSAVHGGV